MRTAIAGFVNEGFTHVAFGDLFLEDVRRYRETRLAGTGLEPLFPLWKTKPTRDLAHDMIEGGLEARLTCVNPKTLDRSFAALMRCDFCPERAAAGHRPVRETDSTRSYSAAQCSPRSSTSRPEMLSTGTDLSLPI